jgi:hypothetical protein
MSKHSGYNKHVAAALGTMGIDTGVKERAERAERGRVDPRVARILEGVGVKYKQEDIAGNLNEDNGMNPLDAPGEGPAVDPVNGKPNGMQPQNKQQGGTQDPNQRPRSSQPAKPAQVKLKQGSSTGIKSLQDVSDKLTQATANIKLVDTLIQALTENNSSDNRIETHKLTLQGPIQALFNSVKDLQKLVE